MFANPNPRFGTLERVVMGIEVDSFVLEIPEVRVLLSSSVAAVVALLFWPYDLVQHIIN
jgi:hypothetical protein